MKQQLELPLTFRVVSKSSLLVAKLELFRIQLLGHDQIYPMNLHKTWVFMSGLP